MKTTIEKTNDSARSSAAFTSGWRKGVALVCLLLTAALASRAQEQQPSPDVVKFKTLVNFNGANGATFTYVGLSPVEGTDGNLYGTTYQGGANNSGTFFKMTPTGALNTVYNFCSLPNCADGGNPLAAVSGGLALGTDGNFYGTAINGGAYGNGTFFQITPGGTLTTLHSFCPDPPNCIGGDSPLNGVVQGLDGNFYGVTAGGGTNNDEPGPCGAGVYGPGCGTVFKVTPEGTFTSIYSFCSQANCADGASPATPLLAASDGHLYGITGNGGANGYGTIFKITPGGKLTTLYTFPAPAAFSLVCQANATSCGPMIQATDGNFYGVGSGGGANLAGMVFKLTAGGTFSILYSFCAQTNCIDGSNPVGVIEGSDGSVYGTTSGGGRQNSSCDSYLTGCGTIFRITRNGVLTTLHRFSGTDGSLPTGLTQATNGVFYGATTWNGNGTLFALSAGVHPFVELLPGSGKAGSPMQILGSNLTGATAVSFNGTAASFMVVSKNLISATVPTGATSGFVTVTTPGGTLKSNTRFVARP